MAQSIVQRTCAKLRSAIGDEAVTGLNFTGDLREMLEALEAIQPVLDKTEMQPLRDRSASGWLWRVRDAAYKIMDMVDELQHTRSPAAATVWKVKRMLPRLTFKKKVMAIKVEETKKTLTKLKEECPRLVSVEEDNISLEVIDERITGPLFKEALVFGRGSDKQRIMAVLLSAPSNISQGLPRCIILPIFGIAGSGKTTLAQMVFNDTHSFLQEYNFRVWVHVSPKFDFYKIGESILGQVVSRRRKILCQVVSVGGQKEVNDDHDSNSDVLGMERLMNRLHELLNGTKVLLVLDDLWEEDPIQLQLLKSMLAFLGDKVDVIVTTCNQAIARKICTNGPYRLNPLGDDTCWNIIKKSVRLQEEEEKKFEKIGREIASKCRGIPSAARAYAAMLQSQDPTIWIKVMERNIWNNISSFHLPILLMLSTFELSYRSMPPDLRLCFAYCAIFPYGHNIVKDDLIRQWIALDLIEPSEGLSTIQIAEEYITRLLDMSFLQVAESQSASGKGAILFTMHGLAHEFARWFALLEYIYEDDIPIRRVHYRVIINLSGELDDEYDDYLRALRCVSCSKMSFKDDSFSFRRCLRVLELNESSVWKLPDSICELRHLGYLKISEFSGLVTLPESFGRLINLFHIDLSGCCGLVNLPESFGNLVHLVHVNLSGCTGLLNLPESFGKLLKLDIINLSGCSALTTLPESFENLVNLSHINLSHCHGLAEILEMLPKLDKLVYLDLSFWSCFQGIKKCLGGLTNLQHLNLSNPCCYLDQHRSHLQELKDVMGKLTKLRYLNLSMCLNPLFYYQTEKKNLEYIQICTRGLTSLEHLDLSHNIFLVDLPESLGDLSKLHTLDLSGCLRLKRLAKRIGELSSLKLIVLKNCQYLESYQFMVRDGPYNGSSNLVELEVVDCKELEISCLEKVKSLEEAQRIRLVEKEKLEKLKLCWTVGTAQGSGEVDENALLGEPVPRHTLQTLEKVKSLEEARRIRLVEKEKPEKLKLSGTVGTAQGSREVDENALLGELVPPHTLQTLELHGYNGETCLPAWWTRSICSSNLLNIIEITMDNFPRCKILPQLGLLPNLKLLVLRRMGSITRIDDIDLSGGDRAAFSRLSKVTIDDMENLKVFIFPGVAELVIQKCPKLSFGPHLPRAQRLLISDCNKVFSSWGERQEHDEQGSCSSNPVTELVIENNNLPLDGSSLLHHLPGLHSLTIKNSHGMISLPEYLSDLTSLREITIQSCHGMESLPQSMDKLTNLKDLYILDCPGLNKWCESEENKLAHIRPKYEKSGTSRTGEQHLHMQRDLPAQSAQRALSSRQSLRRQNNML